MHCAPITPSALCPGMTVHTLSLRIADRRFSAEVRVPARVTKDMPPLLALHGISRDHKGIAQAFSRHCAQKGQVLITPHFTKKSWPRFQKIGGIRPDKALLALLSLVQDMGLADTRRVELFGFSGGAQLAHRFAMLYPQRIEKLHLAAAGWYCLPEPSEPFPMGIGQPDKPLKFDVPALAHGQLRAYLQLNVHLYVGAYDINRDVALRKNAHLDDTQGRHRLARARTFARSFRSAAQARGIDPNFSMTELPDCGHSFAACAAKGLTTLVCTS